MQLKLAETNLKLGEVGLETGEPNRILAQQQATFCLHFLDFVCRGV